MRLSQLSQTRGSLPGQTRETDFPVPTLVGRESLSLCWLSRRLAQMGASTQPLTIPPLFNPHV